MEKLGRKIVRFRIPIFIIGLLLLIPSVFGYINTRVNYDVLYYLPDSIETMQGQDILVDEFGTGAYSMFICEGMENKDVARLSGMTVLRISAFRWRCCRRTSERPLMQTIPR